MRFRLHELWIATSHDGGDSWELTEGPLEDEQHASAVGKGLDCRWIAVRVTSLEGQMKKTAEEFIASVARMLLSSELTEDEQQTGDDPAEALDRLIEEARRLR